MINRTPEVIRLAVYLHEHLVEVPFPVPEAAHAIDPLAAYLACKHRPEPIPPETHRLVANVDAALEQQILDVAQRQRKSDVHQHNQADNLRRRVETPNGLGGLAFDLRLIALKYRLPAPAATQV